MSWKYEIVHKTLHFREPAGTSRGVYTTRDVWYVILHDTGSGRFGVGECAPLPDLSVDAGPDFCGRLDAVCKTFAQDGDFKAIPWECPSMRFGLETALLHAKSASVRFFKTPYSRGEEDISFNGLVWMGDKNTMMQRVKAKFLDGHSCIKLKIGGIDFESELEMLALLRELGPDPAKLEIRLDANGAFTPENAMKRLEALARFSPHSIEQPIRQGQWDAMAELCKNSPIPVALDEELIGCPKEGRRKLMETLRPAHVVLKPTLLGGFKACEGWVDLAATVNAGFWITSALESNIGLNAIAQWCGTLDLACAQGLGTGQLFTDNCELLPSHVRGTAMHCDPDLEEPDLLGWLGADQVKEALAQGQG